MTLDLVMEGRDEKRARLPSVVYRSIDLLKPDGGNARKHNKKQITRIARSIQEFGFNVPILIDANLNVIAGHGRLLAARQLGLSDVPTISLQHLTSEQAKAFAIADNRLGELSRWNIPVLREALSELSKLELDFSLDITGFTIPKIELLTEGTAPQPDPADKLPPASAGPTVCRPGDLWELGPHRIYCGSAIDEPSYEVLLAEDRAAMVFAEPMRDAGRVYRVPSVGNEIWRFLTQLCALLSFYGRPGSLHYLCADWFNLDQVLNAALQARFKQVGLCVWAKDKRGTGALYQSEHELVLVFEQCRLHEPDPNLRNKRGRPRSDLWRYPELRSSRGDRERIKPVRLIADAVLDSTMPGEIVLDTFLGQGTTLIAAEQTKRACRGVDVDPRAVDAAIRRWQAFTGKPAYHSATRRTFQETSSTFGDRI